MQIDHSILGPATVGRLRERITSGSPRLAKHLGRRWYWMSVTVLALGVLSVAMLIWTDRIRDRQRTHFAFANALMDLRIAAATSHLWLEEAISGKGAKEIGRTWFDLGEVKRLSKVVLHGGNSEYGLIVEPLVETTLRQRAEEVARLASDWLSIARERIENSAVAGEGSAIETESDAIFDRLQDTARELEKLVEERLASDYTEANELVTAIVLCWALVLGAATVWLFDWQRTQRRSEAVLQSARDELEFKVAERTRQLRGLNDQLRLELNARRKAEETVRASEKQLRHLSSQLLSAQEEERSRIAKELHDQLGHSLILVKIRLELMHQKVSDDQAELREECQHVLKFIDEIIEEVRRLSKELRPFALDTLGLSGALSWLMHNLDRCHRTIDVDGLPLDEMNHLLSPDVQVVVFRTIQEAMTNVEKHANARRVSLRVTRGGHCMRFVVEDDGSGFNVQETASDGLRESGIGLATMDERARMVNGSLTVWSEKGKGARIALSVPVPSWGSA